MAGIVKFACPCCKAELELDPATGSVGQRSGERKEIDLAAEVARLKAAPEAREAAFQKSMEAEKKRVQRLDDRFDELLKKAKDGPAGPWPRDIDL